MPKTAIFSKLTAAKAEGHKLFAVLIDPDKVAGEQLLLTLELAEQSGADLFLVGGSTVANGQTAKTLQFIKQHSTIPMLLFPGDHQHLSDAADALLFLSMVSGRNAEYMIGQQVAAAEWLRQHPMEVISTAYMLIDGGGEPAVKRVTQTQPIPLSDSQLAADTAFAARLMGFKATYLEAGSGAKEPVPTEMIQVVRQQITGPLFVGGGIRNENSAAATARAGADVVVVGNILEKDPTLMPTMVKAVHQASSKAASL